MAVDVLERLCSAEDFLLWESEQTFKYELIDNRIYPMPGGSRAHENTIAGLISYFFFIVLAGKVGEVYGGGMKVLVDALTTYTYPDVTVVFGEPRFRHGAKSGPLENPTLLFEVLSPSTEKIDRTRKMELYLQIPSVQGYFLVSQDKPLIEGYTRAGDQWVFGESAGLDARLRIPALDCEIPLRDVYRRVSFEDA